MAVPSFAQTPQITGERNHGILGWFSNNYTAHAMPNPSFEDSPRLDKLMRAGNIYLSLRDAIALALENNLDLESARYNPKLADANLMRAKAGALLRNVSNTITSRPFVGVDRRAGEHAVGLGRHRRRRVEQRHRAACSAA